MGCFLSFPAPHSLPTSRTFYGSPLPSGQNLNTSVSSSASDDTSSLVSFKYSLMPPLPAFAQPCTPPPPSAFQPNRGDSLCLPDWPAGQRDLPGTRSTF